jgi:hypothetical protein
MPFSPVEISYKKDKESAAKYVLIGQVRKHSKRRRGIVVGSDKKTNLSFYLRVTAKGYLRRGQEWEFLGALRQTASREASERCRKGLAVESLKRVKLAGEQRVTRNASC